MGCSRAVKENFWLKPFSSKLFCLHAQVFPRFRGFVRDCGCGACVLSIPCGCGSEAVWVFEEIVQPSWN